MKHEAPITDSHPSAASASPRGAVRRMAILVAAALAVSLGMAGLAPAFQTPPEQPVYPERDLSREWRGHRPDLNVDHMFRQDMPRQGSFQDAFMQPR